MEPHAADAEYYRALESKSVKLQNRVSEIVKAVEFHGNDNSLMEAINHYKDKDGALTQSAPSEFLEADERKALFNDDGKFRMSLYKAMLFLKIADAIKAGSLNLSPRTCPERRKELIEQFKRASMATWKHVNLHGEYDFSDEKMMDSVGLESTPNNLELTPV